MKRIKCIVVDDEPLAVSLLGSYVEKIPFFELAFSKENPIEALEYIRKNEADLIFLDIQMPEMNGAAALKLIREHKDSKDTPVIILTNLGEEEAPSEMRSLGISSYIVKANNTPRQVVAHVKNTIGL